MAKKESSKLERILKRCYHGFMAATLTAILALSTAPHFKRREYNAVVTQKESIQYNKGNKYLVWVKTDDGQKRVLENTDSILEGKYKSSELYGNLKKGKKYKIKTYGWRIPFMDRYENIVKVSPKSK